MNGGDDTFTADAGPRPRSASRSTSTAATATTSSTAATAADLLKGGNGNDRIMPDDNPAGTRDDARGDAGDDTIVWNGGDDDDLNDGGDGNDTVAGQRRGGGRDRSPSSPVANGHVIFDRTAPTPTPVPGSSTST